MQSFLSCWLALQLLFTVTLYQSTRRQSHGEHKQWEGCHGPGGEGSAEGQPRNQGGREAKNPDGQPRGCRHFSWWRHESKLCCCLRDSLSVASMVMPVDFCKSDKWMVVVWWIFKAPLEKEEFLAWQQDLEADDKGPTLDRPTVFRWTGDGKEVYLSGSFNNWANKIPLIRRWGGILTSEIMCYFCVDLKLAKFHDILLTSYFIG